MGTAGARTVYLPYVDGLRAIAVLSVVLYHLNAAWLPGGFTGVDIFFVISGFIVSASVGGVVGPSVGAAQGGGIGRFLAFFYARRVLRILPALIVCLLATTLACALLVPGAWLSESNQRTGLYAFFGLSNFVLAGSTNDYFSPTAEFNPYTHTWSLAVEEQFYLVFPLLFFAWTRMGRWRGASLALFAIAVVASLAWSIWLAGHDRTAAFYMLTSRFWQLGAGVLLYQCMTLSGRRFDTSEQASPKWIALVAPLSLLSIAYALWTARPEATPFPGSLPAVLGALGLLGSLHGQDGRNPLVRLLSARPVLFVGRISYSLYLWHWPVFVLFRWTVGLEAPVFRVLALLLSVALAIASYRWVETPMRRLPAAQRAPRLALVCIGLVCVGLSAQLARGIHHAQPDIALNTVTQHAHDWYPQHSGVDIEGSSCKVEMEQHGLGSSHYQLYRRAGCEGPVNGPRVYAIGDSHSSGYAGMYKRYVAETGAPVVLYGNAGCPFIGLRQSNEQQEPCASAIATARDDMLERLRPGDVVFLASLRLPRFADQWARFPDDQARHVIFSEEAARGRAKAVDEAEQMIAAFRAKGAWVVFEAPKPIFKAPTYRCAEPYQATNPICAAGSTMPREEVVELRRPILQAMSQLMQRVPGVSLWDPMPLLCPDGEVCSPYAGKRPLFFDADHLSGYGNGLLAPSFIEAMRGLQKGDGEQQRRGLIVWAGAGVELQ